jgi:sugar phosphate isomerase/epimerase
MQWQADPKATLAKVAQVGFNSVEGATYTGTQKFYGMAPAEFAQTLKDNGLNNAKRALYAWRRHANRQRHHNE